MCGHDAPFLGSGRTTGHRPDEETSDDNFLFTDGFLYPLAVTRPLDDEVLIDRSGNVRAQGSSALLRMQARAGSFSMLASPPSIVLMRRADGAEPARACLMAGEIRAPGVLCDLIAFIGQTGWRGELLVFQGSDWRSIYFDQGNVVGTCSTVVRERLGEVLYRHGVLSREQVDQCSDATVTGQQRFGEAAVKAGFVGREQLFRLMARQDEEIVFGALFVEAGSYYFLQGYNEADLSALAQIPVGNLVRDGVRRMHEARFFRARIPSERHVPMRVASPDVDPLGVFALIDGARSIADLCRTLGLGEFEVTRAVFQLASSGHVTIRAPKVPPREAVSVFNEAISLVLRELDALDQGDDVRGLLQAFVATRPAWLAVLEGAGPADDGTLDAARVEHNLGASADDQVLRTLLYEYASYALFLARPHLKRNQPTPPSDRRRVSLQVSAILEPLAPSKRPGDDNAGSR